MFYTAEVLKYKYQIFCEKRNKDIYNNDILITFLIQLLSSRIIQRIRKEKYISFSELINYLNAIFECDPYVLLIPGYNGPKDQHIDEMSLINILRMIDNKRILLLILEIDVIEKNYDFFINLKTLSRFPKIKIKKVSESIFFVDKEQLPKEILNIKSYLYREIKLIKMNEWELLKNQYVKKTIKSSVSESFIETIYENAIDIIDSNLTVINRQLKTPIGIIDLLAKDNDNTFVVIELKKEKTDDRTVGQILRYMGYIKKQYNQELVKGIIMVPKITEKLLLAQSMVPGLVIKELKKLHC
jgi:hypothetical protein